MNPPTMSPYQTTGNICVGIAALIFLLPLNYLLWFYARPIHFDPHVAAADDRVALRYGQRWI